MVAFVKTIADFYKQGIEINNEISYILALLLLYKAVYFVLGMFFTRKFSPAKTKHKYGICIAARNEEAVIGNLLDSINRQDYPKDLYKVFVVADNCTDNTYKVAKEKGATVYKRFDDKHRTKGFALQYLFEKIEQDYKRSSFDGFFIFDADNLLKEDYISRMNDAFDSGEKIITSFRNTKNFDENWIASTYALHWIRSARTNHRARSILRLATNIQGTGFLFASEIVRNGWKYTSLTEDRALTADCVAAGYRISYQDAAEFYDEQPVSLRIALRQRLRWSKGHLQAFAESGPYLFINIFFGKLILKKDWRDLKQTEDRNLAFKILESVRHRFASFDTLVQLTPLVFINLLRWFILYVLIYGCYAYTNGATKYLFGGGNDFATTLREYCDLKWKLPPGLKTMFICMALAVLYRLIYRVGEYTRNMMDAVYFFLVEYARIKKMNIFKKILYVFTWPIFDIIGRYTTYIALFTKVTWKPIPHNSKVTIDDLRREK
ncbi:MAG: glycosyltransferase [Clostridia bacterium]|nr:glycosyltransferase [Clostridia bacterium]